MKKLNINTGLNIGKMWPKAAFSPFFFLQKARIVNKAENISYVQTEPNHR